MGDERAGYLVPPWDTARTEVGARLWRRFDLSVAVGFLGGGLLAGRSFLATCTAVRCGRLLRNARVSALVGPRGPLWGAMWSGWAGVMWRSGVPRGTLRCGPSCAPKVGGLGTWAADWHGGATTSGLPIWPRRVPRSALSRCCSTREGALLGWFTWNARGVGSRRRRRVGVSALGRLVGTTVPPPKALPIWPRLVPRSACSRRCSIREECLWGVSRGTPTAWEVAVAEMCLSRHLGG
jgi:hypothetical protein